MKRSPYIIIANMIRAWLNHILSGDQDGAKILSGVVHKRFDHFARDWGWSSIRDSHSRWLKVIDSHDKGSPLSIVRDLAEDLIYHLRCLDKTVTNTSQLKGTRSKPAPKTAYMRALGIDSRSRFDCWAQEHDIQQVGGNRQLWTIDLDTVDSVIRAKIEDL